MVTVKEQKMLMVPYDCDIRLFLHFLEVTGIQPHSNIAIRLYFHVDIMRKYNVKFK